MTNQFKFDLENKQQFPELGRIAGGVIDFNNRDLDYLKENAEFENVINKTREYVWGKLEEACIEWLLKERELLIINILSKSQREIIIETYNRKVIERMEMSIDFIHQCFEIHNLEFNDLQKEELNLKGSFTEWYKEFSNDEPIQIPLPTAGNTETPTNGTQEPIQTDNLLRFDNVGQKYLLLKELGIIDFLDSKYTFTSNAKKSLLYAYITDTKNSKSFENVLTNIDNKKSDKYPYVEKNVNKINRIFDELSVIEQNKIAAVKRDNKK